MYPTEPYKVTLSSLNSEVSPIDAYFRFIKKLQDLEFASIGVVWEHRARHTYTVCFSALATEEGIMFLKLQGVKIQKL